MSLYFNNIGNRKYNTWCNYTLRLDTYGCGCEHDCCYCYAKSLLKFRGLWDSKTPKIATLWEIKRVINKLPKNSIIKLGGMSDCFMPLEKKQQITFNTIKLLNYYKIHYLIVTKSNLVSSNEYIKIYDKNLAHFQISITSTNEIISKKHEKVPTPFERIEAIEKLYKLGFDVSIRLSPFVTEFINIDVINSIKCNKILIEFLKVNHWIKKWFKIDYKDYSLKYGGYEHLQLENKIKIIDGSAASTGVPNRKLYVLAQNNNGVIQNPTTRQISMAFAGAGMTQTQVNNFTDPFEVAMDALGTGVIP